MLVLGWILGVSEGSWPLVACSAGSEGLDIKYIVGKLLPYSSPRDLTN